MTYMCVCVFLWLEENLQSVLWVVLRCSPWTFQYDQMFKSVTVAAPSVWNRRIGCRHK